MHEPRRPRARLIRPWRDLPVRAKGLIVVAIPMVALVASAAVFLVVDAQNRRANEAVARTLEVQNALENVQVLVLNAETGGRGYVLTGDSRFLEPLEAARDQLPDALNQLRRLLDDDPAQTTRIDAVDALIDARLALSERAVEFGPDDIDSETLLGILEEGRVVTDDIRAQVAEIATVEQQRLEQLRDDADTAQRRGIASIVAALLAGLVGGVATTMLFSRGVSSRLGDLQRDAERVAAGEPAIATVEGDDEIGTLARSLATAREQVDQHATDLRHRESELRAIFDASPDIIVVFDVEGTVVSVNEAISTVLGFADTERHGAAARDFIHPDDFDRFDDALHRIANGTDDQVTLRLRIRHADGAWIDIEARGHAVATSDLAPHQVLLVLRDIREQVELEAAQRGAREAAETANRAKSEFLSHMSHELRTPLNAVLGFAQILELDDLHPDQRDAVDHILKGGRHLLMLINEVLDLARIDSGEMALSPESVHVGDLILDAAELIAPLAAERSITVHRDPGCDHHVLADRQRTKQVLLNLLSNAVKYNRAGGSITLRCQHDPHHVRMSVTDTGFGIAPEHQHLLFTPFERLHHHTDIEGTGVGLALSRRLTEAMGGSLQLDDTSAQGSTFTLQLPLAEAPTDRHERLSANHEREPSATPPTRTRHTIIHIEDNLANLKLIERILQARTDIRVVTTMQGRLAIELIREHQPALVLLDLHLPDINGDEVLRQLLADPATSNIPVVILSADATQREIQRLLAAGAHSYLTKPVDVRALTATIHTLLADAPPPREPHH